MIRLLEVSLILAAVAVNAMGQQTASSPDMVPACSVRTEPASGPVAVGNDPQLFIDHYLISEWRGLKRVTHCLRRILDRPILTAQQGTRQPYLTVVRDPDTRKFRMWYDWGLGPDAAIAYAESDDGMTWTTPSLGILGDDNRVLKISTQYKAGYGASLIDEGPGYPDKARRFKLAWYGQEKQDERSDLGVRVAFSPDGLHWTPWDGNPVLHARSQTDESACPSCVGDIVDVYRDPVRGHYAAFVKLGASAADGWTRGPRAKGSFRRLVGASISRDFTHWETPWRVVVPEARDEGKLEFYTVGGTIARGPLLIGFVRMLHDDLPATPGGPADGIGYATIATSRDGRHWQRHDDIFFDRDPNPEAWDHAMTWISCVLPVGDELYVYYGGYKRGHKVAKDTERQIGMTRMPMDRFVSWDAAGESPGRLITVPLRLPAGAHRLLLNANASGGRIRVQLKDTLGDQVLPGYSLDDCTPVTADVVRIEFELAHASVFGFRVPQE